jgi:uncharacterized protein YeeX (DUF496 family)
MAIKTKLKQKVPKIEIDLSGPQGNVFCLINLAKKLSRKLDMDGETIVKRMMFDDYEHAVKTFDAYFGDYVTMFVPEDSSLLS